MRHLGTLTMTDIQLSHFFRRKLVSGELNILHILIIFHSHIFLTILFGGIEGHIPDN